MQPPRFFEAIRQSAAKRWDQLEGDPEIAAPWHQLFKQVQSPRHVLSELLQNADDAGATATSVGIDKGYFVFTHNGEDFTEEHLSSMCRFGFSNKRSLHTIGFRGIGFKSTFSLGDQVELRTPTLSLCFRQHRFTEPVWEESDSEVTDGVTEIRVSLRDGLIEREIEKNLKEWLESPLSLLFFKNIRCITVVDQELRWESTGEGPVPGSTWMVLNKDSTHPLLVARSRLEPFPPEALEEIGRERMLASDEIVVSRAE
jgi:Histidine kinase-, DNA gyrase B-, and HSP90-like ATPase